METGGWVGVGGLPDKLTQTGVRLGVKRVGSCPRHDSRRKRVERQKLNMQAEVHGLCRRLVRLEHSILRRKVASACRQHRLGTSRWFHTVGTFPISALMRTIKTYSKSGALL